MTIVAKKVDMRHCFVKSATITCNALWGKAAMEYDHLCST